MPDASILQGVQCKARDDANARPRHAGAELSSPRRRGPSVFLAAAGRIPIPHPVACFIAIALALGHSAVRAADIANATFTPLKAPECIADPRHAFVTETVTPVEPPHATLPSTHYYLIARYLGERAIADAPTYDFGRFPDTYGAASLQGAKLTGLTVPQPRANWQRASHADATADSASALQLHCYDAGSYINTWAFANQAIVGGGPHVIFGYSFNDPPPPRIFDGDPGTDFVLQAAIEIPWVATWPDPSAAREFDPVGQVVLFAYFRDRPTGRVFALLLAVFDNRVGAAGTYRPFVSHDTATPFVSTPLNADIAFATLSPYSSTFTGEPWSGLRFFRAHVTQPDFRRAVDAVNAFCLVYSTMRFCSGIGASGLAFDPDPSRYEITDFGMLHEVFRGGPNGQLTMGVHVTDLGAWNAR